MISYNTALQIALVPDQAIKFSTEIYTEQLIICYDKIRNYSWFASSLELIGSEILYDLQARKAFVTLPESGNPWLVNQLILKMIRKVIL